MIDPEAFLQRHPVREEMSGDVPTSLTSEMTLENDTEGSDSPIESDQETDRCMKSALRSLDAAGASVEGLRKRLVSKGFEEESIDKVIAILQRMQLLDDEAFARGVLSKCLRKMMGASAVRRELTSKGIEHSLAAHVIREAEDRGDFEESARRFVESMARKTEGMEYAKRMRRLASAAQRKGQPTSSVLEYARTLMQGERD